MDKIEHIIKDLKQVKADKDWTKSSREILCTQITNSGASNLSSFKKAWLGFKCFMQTTARPVFVVELAIVLLLVSVFAHQALDQVKPNESLYSAKVFSEKAYLNTIRDNQTRDKVAAQFATKHAKDIIHLLADPEFNTEANSKKVEKLSQNFVREINTVTTAVAKKTSTSSSEVKVKPEEELVFIPETEDVFIATEDDLITTSGIEIELKDDEVDNDNQDNEVNELEEGELDLETLILQKEFEHALLKLAELEQSLED